MTEMPRYKCHKEVRALHIRSIWPDLAGSALLWFYEDGPNGEEWPAVSVTGEWLAKHMPHDGGYYVLYDDNYSSFSPAKAFEEGYTRIDDAIKPTSGYLVSGALPPFGGVQEEGDK